MHLTIDLTDEKRNKVQADLDKARESLADFKLTWEEKLSDIYK